ncbi:hypothetical protein GTW69_07410 [Streptomyces sp. SID7760]|nr:hypothetical protein [Streptomyces sp. SID7760]
MPERTQHSKPTITHPTGLTFTVIPADSYDARVVARDRRPLVMADGKAWTVGTLGYGSAFAWRSEEADRG